MYIFRENRLELPIQVHSLKETAEEMALVDSGAMENFIDLRTVNRLRLGTKKLEQSVKLHNIDGSENTAGRITHYLDLIVRRGNMRRAERFFVSNLGKDRIILGYPWLEHFDPEVDWKNAKLLGPMVHLKTPVYAKFTSKKRLLEEEAKKKLELRSAEPEKPLESQVPE